jgi:DNA polymerase III delta subunit
MRSTPSGKSGNEFGWGYIVAGSPYFIKDTLTSLTAARKGNAEAHSYYEFGTETAGVLNELLTEPFFDDFKIVVYHLTEDKEKKGKKDDREVFAPFRVQTPALFIITLQDIKRAEKIHAVLTDYKLLAEKKHTQVEQNKAAQTIFSKIKPNFSYGSAEMICKIFEDDMAMIASEAEKLSLYYHAKPPKTDDEILAHISGGVHAKIWGFFGAFLTKKGGEALRVLSQLQEPDAEMIFSMLVYYYAGIFFIVAKLPVRPDEAPITRSRKYIFKNLWDFAKYWDRESIAKIIGVHRILDLRRKTGGLTAFDALMLLTAEIYS